MRAQKDEFQVEWWAGKQNWASQGIALPQGLRNLVKANLCHQLCSVAEPLRQPKNVAFDLWIDNSHRWQGFSWHAPRNYPPWSLHILIYCFWDHYYSWPPLTLALLIDSGQIKKCQNHSECYPLIPTLCDPIDYSPPKRLCPWNSPGKSTGKNNNNNNTGVGCRFLLQGIFLTQGLNPDLLHCRQILYHLSHQGSF